MFVFLSAFISYFFLTGSDPGSPSNSEIFRKLEEIQEENRKAREESSAKLLKDYRAIILNQEEMKEEIRIIKRSLHLRSPVSDDLKMLNRSLHKLEYPVVEEVIEPFTFPLPICTDEELQTVEEMILLPNKKRSLIHELASIGGNQINAVVRHIMKKIFNKDMALKYSFKGKGKLKKRSFKDLNIYSCVVGKYCFELLILSILLP